MRHNPKVFANCPGWIYGEKRKCGAAMMREERNDGVIQKFLKWFVHMKRMSGEQLARRGYRSEVDRRRDRIRPCTK